MNEIYFYKKPEYITDLSKKLRKCETKSEKVLWEHLKGKQLDGLRFHRQKTIFAFRENNGADRFYIADFYCNKKKLIIELDGCIHNSSEQKDYDRVRDEILKNNNYKILRFSNDEIFNNINSVLNKIKNN